jgi:peptidoglycan/xylan/chitin deacetylase (PgdA/CDA1 family)
VTVALYYHRVGPFRDGAPRKMTVTPENFRAQMAAIAKGAGAVSLDDAAAGKPGVAITFDDGFRDCLEFALPELRARGFAAAFFIVAGLVGKTDDWMRVTKHPPERLMEWDDLKRLRDEGFTIGSHTMTHTVVTREEVVESRRLLEERLGVPIRHFAYPRGEHTPESVAWVREAGYASGWATKGGPDGPFTRRRLPVSASLSPLGFRFKLFKARLGWYG